MTFHNSHDSNRVVESKNEKYSVGDLVLANFGWRSHTITDGKDKLGDPWPSVKLDTAVHSSPSTALGVLGMPG